MKVQKHARELRSCEIQRGSTELKKPLDKMREDFLSELTKLKSDFDDNTEKVLELMCFKDSPEEDTDDNHI